MPRGRPRRWPWDTWLNGEKHVLVSGVDFVGVDVDSLQQQVLTEARKRGIEVETRTKRNVGDDKVDVLGIRPRQPVQLPPIDWDATLAGLPRRLTKGTDFACSVAAMRVRAYQAAQRRGIRISTTETNPGVLSLYPVTDESATEMASSEETR